MKNKPFEPYKIDQYFGNPTSYGLHEGLDLNGLGGGNTDCLTPLKAMFTGRIIHVSYSNKDYGKLVVLEVVLGGKTYYIRYCHCHEIKVAQGDLVTQGTVIALMGSTGNSTACHLHLDILKKKPTHWRYYARTRSRHAEYFIDPLDIMNQYKESDMAEEMYDFKGFGELKIPIYKTKAIELDNFLQAERQRLVDERSNLKRLKEELALTQEQCQLDKQEIRATANKFFNNVEDILGVEDPTYSFIENWIRDNKSDAEYITLDKASLKQTLHHLVDLITGRIS